MVLENKTLQLVLIEQLHAENIICQMEQSDWPKLVKLTNE